MHVHLREPGFEHKETIESGTKAAVKGGFTTVAAMPNTKPIMDTKEKVEQIYQKNQELSIAKVLQIGAITTGELGETLTDFLKMKEAGTIGFSDDGKGIHSSGLMKKAMEQAKKVDLPIIAHCEDMELVENGVIHDGMVAKELQLPGIPAASEYVQLARDLELAELTGVHYHVCHVSSKRSVELIRLAKQRGVQVTAEVTPHHLLLSESDMKEPYSQYKMNPPLRSEEDRQALLEGLIDGTIDVIATDHAPHSMEEKGQGISKAPFGIVGLETAFPLLYTHLVKQELVSLEQLIDWLTIKPAGLLRLEEGTIAVGKKADITIIDLEQLKCVEPEKFASKGKNTPFAGWQLQGWPTLTMVNGKIQWQEDGLEVVNWEKEKEKEKEKEVQAHG